MRTWLKQRCHRFCQVLTELKSICPYKGKGKQIILFLTKPLMSHQPTRASPGGSANVDGVSYGSSCINRVHQDSGWCSMVKLLSSYVTYIISLGSKDGKKGRKDQPTARARMSTLSYSSDFRRRGGHHIPTSTPAGRPLLYV